MKADSLLKYLIKIPSPSGQEKEIGEFIIEKLESNFQIKKQKIGNRFNILAYTGEPKVILTTHMDTVPRQLEVKEDEKFIYGRGACDAKASIASMIIAANKLVEKEVSDFGLLFDVSEEDDFSGIVKAVNLVNPKYVILGEPTDLKLVRGQKGLLGFKLIAKGESAPGSTPSKGISAINKIISNLNKLNEMDYPRNNNLGRASINIGKISGGEAINVVPDYAEAEVKIRTVGSNQEILEKLEQMSNKYEILTNFEPVLLEDDIAKEWGDKMNLATITVPYFTEMYFWSKKSNCVVFGPGKYKYAHSDKERIKKRDLNNAVDRYIEMVTYLNKQKLNKPINE